MPRRTPVEELLSQDSGKNSPVRRSMRISQNTNSPAPSKVTTRRNSSTDSSTATAKLRRSSVESTGSETEVKRSTRIKRRNSRDSPPKVEDVLPVKRVTRQSSVSKDDDAKTIDEKPSTKRTTRRSSITKDDDVKKVVTRRRSSEDEPKKPKPRTRRASLNTEIEEHEKKIETIHNTRSATNKDEIMEVEVKLTPVKKRDTAAKSDFNLSIINETSFNESDSQSNTPTKSQTIKHIRKSLRLSHEMSSVKDLPESQDSNVAAGSDSSLSSHLNISNVSEKSYKDPSPSLVGHSSDKENCSPEKPEEEINVFASKLSQSVINNLTCEPMDVDETFECSINNKDDGSTALLDIDLDKGKSKDDSQFDYIVQEDQDIENAENDPELKASEKFSESEDETSSKLEVHKTSQMEKLSKETSVNKQEDRENVEGKITELKKSVQTPTKINSNEELRNVDDENTEAVGFSEKNVSLNMKIPLENEQSSQNKTINTTSENGASSMAKVSEYDEDLGDKINKDESSTIINKDQTVVQSENNEGEEQKIEKTIEEQSPGIKQTDVILEDNENISKDDVDPQMSSSKTTTRRCNTYIIGEIDTFLSRTKSTSFSGEDLENSISNESISKLSKSLQNTSRKSDAKPSNEDGDEQSSEGTEVNSMRVEFDLNSQHNSFNDDDEEFELKLTDDVFDSPNTTVSSSKKSEKFNSSASSIEKNTKSPRKSLRLSLKKNLESPQKDNNLKRKFGDIEDDQDSEIELNSEITADTSLTRQVNISKKIDNSLEIEFQSDSEENQELNTKSNESIISKSSMGMSDSKRNSIENINSETCLNLSEDQNIKENDEKDTSLKKVRRSSQKLNISSDKTAPNIEENLSKAKEEDSELRKVFDINNDDTEENIETLKYQKTQRKSSSKRNSKDGIISKEQAIKPNIKNKTIETESDEEDNIQLVMELDTPESDMEEENVEQRTNERNVSKRTSERNSKVEPISSDEEKSEHEKEIEEVLKKRKMRRTSKRYSKADVVLKEQPTQSDNLSEQNEDNEELQNELNRQESDMKDENIGTFKRETPQRKSTSKRNSKDGITSKKQAMTPDVKNKTVEAVSDEEENIQLLKKLDTPESDMGGENVETLKKGKNVRKSTYERDSLLLAGTTLKGQSMKPDVKNKTTGILSDEEKSEHEEENVEVLKKRKARRKSTSKRNSKSGIVLKEQPEESNYLPEQKEVNEEPQNELDSPESDMENENIETLKKAKMHRKSTSKRNSPGGVVLKKQPKESDIKNKTIESVSDQENLSEQEETELLQNDCATQENEETPESSSNENEDNKDDYKTNVSRELDESKKMEKKKSKYSKTNEISLEINVEDGDLNSSKQKAKNKIEVNNKSTSRKLSRSGETFINDTDLKEDITVIEKIDQLIASEINSASEDSSEDETTEINDYIDDMVEEGEEDTPSEGSNDIVDLGESINTTESEMSTNDEYETNSFIADDESYELLTGDEYDISMDTNEKKKKNRIIQLGSDSENCGDIIKIERKPKIKKKPTRTRIIKHEASTDEEDFEISNEEHVEKDVMKLADKTQEDNINVSTPKGQTQAVYETSSSNKKSIIIHENIRVDNIRNKVLSDRIQEVVNSFCSNINKKGEVSLNVSLDYAASTDSDNKTTINEIQEDAQIDEPKKKSKKKKKKLKPSANEADLNEASEVIELPDKNPEKKGRKRKCEEKSDETVEVADKKKKKKKSKKTTDDLRDDVFNVLNRTAGEEKRVLRERKIRPTVVQNDNAWIVGPIENLFNVKPSTSMKAGEKSKVLKKPIVASKSEINCDVQNFHPKDFRNRMLYDSSRIKRTENKNLLKKKGMKY